MFFIPLELHHPQHVHLEMQPMMILTTTTDDDNGNSYMSTVSILIIQSSLYVQHLYSPLSSIFISEDQRNHDENSENEKRKLRKAEFTEINNLRNK